MRVVSLGVAVAALLLAVPLSGPAPEPVQRGLDALHASGVRNEAVLEAVVAAGQDPRAWQGEDLLAHITVPPPGRDAVAPLREAYAVLSAGAGPVWDDPVRGAVDLREDLRANLDAVMATSDDAALSFQMLAMAAGDMEVPAALRERLLGLQRGGWGCGPWLGPECTGYALAALHATGGIPAATCAEAVAFLDGRFLGAAYSDPRGGPDVQVTVWAMQGLRLCGREPPAAATLWLLGQQGPDGMWRVAGRPDAWATAEAIVMLSGGHPL